MEETTYFGFLILWAVFSQGIGALSDGNFGGSSNLLMRKKRIINNTPNGNSPVQFTMAAYTVRFIENNVTFCSGSIIHPIVIITTSTCIDEFVSPLKRIFVLSGSATRKNSRKHHILNAVTSGNNPPRNRVHRVSIVRIYPAINICENGNRVMKIYTGPINFNESAMFSSWRTIELGSEYSDELRVTRLPLLDPLECIRLYKKRYAITNKHICTLDTTGRRGSSTEDEGGSLVYREHLLGMFDFRMGPLNKKNPEVFMNLKDLDYRHFVRDNAPRFGVTIEVETT